MHTQSLCALVLAAAAALRQILVLTLEFTF